MPKPLTSVADAKKIAKRINADAVVVIAFIGDTAHGASYGANRKKCEATGEWLDHLLDDMGDGLTPRPQL